MGLEEIYQDVVDGKNVEVEKGVSDALEQGIDANEILKKGLIAAMREVGRRFEEGEYYVPEMLISARAMKAGLAILKPRLIEGGVESAGKLAIGTVQGDLHETPRSARPAEGGGGYPQRAGSGAEWNELLHDAATVGTLPDDLGPLVVLQAGRENLTGGGGGSIHKDRHWEAGIGALLMGRELLLNGATTAQHGNDRSCGDKHVGDSRGFGQHAARAVAKIEDEPAHAVLEEIVHHCVQVSGA